MTSNILAVREALEVVKEFIGAYRDRTKAYRERTATQDLTAQELVAIQRKLTEKAL